LLLNPTLSDLVGGIESVTLSDEEARRRGTQKTVLERRAPPTFDVLVEIQERDYLVVHPDVAAAVDALVRGYPLQPEVRYRDEKGEIHIEKPPAPPAIRTYPQGLRRGSAMNGFENGGPVRQSGNVLQRPQPREPRGAQPSETSAAEAGETRLQPIRIYPYGVARNRLMQAAKRLGVPALVVRELDEAEVVMTLRTYYRSRQQTILDAEERGLSIYVLRANTVNQMEQSLADLFNLSLSSSPPAADWEEVAAQTQLAIESVLNGRRYVDLPPANSTIRRLQHEMARQADLVSHSYGKDPYRRVRIFRE
jgi:hypothetical protein